MLGSKDDENGDGDGCLGNESSWMHGLLCCGCRNDGEVEGSKYLFVLEKTVDSLSAVTTIRKIQERIIVVT